MYLCICNEITESDIDKDPSMLLLMGTGCGKCVSDGGVPEIDLGQKIDGQCGVATDRNSDETKDKCC
jgi:hypothetical protein